MSVKVRLLKQHTHEGRDYKAGDVLTVDSDRAAWLKGQGVAETIGEEKTTLKNDKLKD
jgi:hypothetical protein